MEYRIIGFFERILGIDTPKMNLENFCKNFPPDIEPPEELIKLFIFQEEDFKIRKKTEYSGHFRLCVGPWGPQPSFLVNVFSKLIPFASEADGSEYSFWMYKKFDIHNCPIVFTGATWWGNTILANSLTDFLALLSLGVDQLGYAVHHSPDWLEHIPQNIENQNFREWLKTNLDIEVPSNPLELVENARNSHPDFRKWVEEISGFPPEDSKKPPW